MSNQGQAPKLRVLFVNTRSALGADVAVHLTVIKNLDPHRVEVFVATNRNSEDLQAIQDHLSCLPTERVLVCDLGHEVSGTAGGAAGKVRGLLKNLSALGTLARLARFIRSNHIDILHSTDRPRDALFATLLAKWSKRPNLLHIHINWHPYLGRATNWALRSCTGVLAISQFTRCSLVQGGVPDAKIYTVLNSTDTNEFDPARVQRGAFRKQLGLDESTPLIGIVARLMVWKGHLELIEALAKVRDAIPDVRLAIIGKEDLLAAGAGPPFPQQVRERIARYGLERNVLWIGWSDRMPQIMRDLDVLAMPSWEEPFGLAVTEALAMETPVVGFASGALPEIMTDGREGRLVPPKDSDALAAALIEVLGDSGLRTEMGRKGRARVLDAFTPRRQADEVESVYRKILDRP